MRIELLEEFVTLADVLNYRIASERLFIAQSTLTKHITALEESLGVRLFERDTRSVELTESGAQLLVEATRVVEAWRRMTARANLLRTGVLRVAVPLKWPRYAGFLADACRIASEHMPASSFRMLDLNLANGPALLLRGEAELLVDHPYGSFGIDEFVTAPLIDVPVRVWVSSEDPLSKRDVVSLKDLDGMSYRTPGPLEHPWSDYILERVRALGFTPNFGDVADDQYRIGPNEYALVCGGRPSGTFGFGAVQVPLAETVTATLSAIYRRGNESEALQAFLNALLEAAHAWKAQQEG